MSVTESCVCGVAATTTSAVEHPYVPATPGCWALFGQVQADEMTRFGYPDAHGWVVDAYTASHPGPGTDPRDTRSVAVHLVALHARLHLGMPSPAVRRLVLSERRVTSPVPPLVPPAQPATVTVLSMLGARDLEDYTARARVWATAVWASWSHEHDRLLTLWAPPA